MRVKCSALAWAHILLQLTFQLILLDASLGEKNFSSYFTGV